MIGSSCALTDVVHVFIFLFKEKSDYEGAFEIFQEEMEQKLAESHKVYNAFFSDN